MHLESIFLYAAFPQQRWAFKLNFVLYLQWIKSILPLEKRVCVSSFYMMVFAIMTPRHSMVFMGHIGHPNNIEGSRQQADFSHSVTSPLKINIFLYAAFPPTKMGH